MKINDGVIKTAANAVYEFLKKNDTQILTGMAIVSGISALIFMPKSIRTADKIKEQKKEELKTKTLTPKQVVKATWKCYIPTAVMECVSVACLLCAASTNLKRNAALSAAYVISQDQMTKYQDKVKEMIGDKKEQEVRDNVAQDEIKKKPLKNSEVIITEKGDTLCYDMYSGIYFKSDRDKINKAVNEVNRKMLTSGSASINDLYYELGINSTKNGDRLGWNIDKGMIDIQFSTVLASDGQTPCLAIDYAIDPVGDFWKFRPF